MVPLFELLAEFARQVPGCRSTSIVDTETGMALVSVSNEDSLAAAGADAFHCDLHRVVGKAMDAVGIESRTEHIVLVAQGAVLLSMPFPQTGCFWHVVTDKSTTVGFTQALMRKYVGGLSTGLHNLVG